MPEVYTGHPGSESSEMDQMAGINPAPLSPIPTSGPGPSMDLDLPAKSENPSRRPQRTHRLPARYRNHLPESAPATSIGTENLNVGTTDDRPSVVRRVHLIVRDSIQTMANTFGLFRAYQHCPTYDPDSTVPSDDLAHVVPETSTEGSIDAIPDTSTSSSTNIATELLLNWQNSGSELKSHAEVNRLVEEVLRHPDFTVEVLNGFEAGRENRKQDKEDEKSAGLQFEGFQETTVKIEVPSGDKNVPSRIFEIPGLQFRKLTTLIQSAFTSPLAPKFHFSPFRLFHQTTSSDEEVVTERVYSELYNSKAFIKEHNKVQRAPLPPDEPDCRREKVVASLMFWSDSTHLAQFRMAKIWPIYMYLGNLSKYTRGEPSSKAGQHVAYIPSLPDSLQDVLASWHPKWKTQKKHLLTHCRRELMHAIWRILLDDDFLHAYTYGIVIKCHDGVERRVYPRIFTYSADYPEK